jgi:hypothetical protein
MEEKNGTDQDEKFLVVGKKRAFAIEVGASNKSMAACGIISIMEAL